MNAIKRLGKCFHGQSQLIFLLGSFNYYGIFRFKKNYKVYDRK